MTAALAALAVAEETDWVVMMMKMGNEQYGLSSRSQHHGGITPPNEIIHNSYQSINQLFKYFWYDDIWHASARAVGARVLW